MRARIAGTIPVGKSRQVPAEFQREPVPGHGTSRGSGHQVSELQVFEAIRRTGDDGTSIRSALV